MTEFFDMGGYAAYIWPAYGISALVLGVIALQSYRDLSRNKKDLALLQEAEGGNRRTRGQPGQGQTPVEQDADTSGAEDVRETQT